MSSYLAIAPCFTCGTTTQFNPEKVPSVYVCLGCKRPADMHTKDCPRTAEVTRLPLCAECVTIANQLRARDGIPLIYVPPGAYSAQVIE
jgi:hypothetical protein